MLMSGVWPYPLGFAIDYAVTPVGVFPADSRQLGQRPHTSSYIESPFLRGDLVDPSPPSSYVFQLLAELFALDRGVIEQAPPTIRYL